MAQGPCRAQRAEAGPPVPAPHTLAGSKGLSWASPPGGWRKQGLSEGGTREGRAGLPDSPWLAALRLGFKNHKEPWPQCHCVFPKLPRPVFSVVLFLPHQISDWFFSPGRGILKAGKKGCFHQQPRPSRVGRGLSPLGSVLESLLVPVGGGARQWGPRKFQRSPLQTA